MISDEQGTNQAQVDIRGALFDYREGVHVPAPGDQGEGRNAQVHPQTLGSMTRRRAKLPNEPNKSLVFNASFRCSATSSMMHSAPKLLPVIDYLQQTNLSREIFSPSRLPRTVTAML